MSNTTAGRDLVLAACSTAGPAEGLVTLALDRRDGTLTRLAGIRADLGNPLYVTAHPTGRFVYVADFVKECDGVAGGAISAFALDRNNGALTPLNRKPAHGSVPCYVSVCRNGRFALVANYGDGSVSVLPIHSDGTLGDVLAHVQHDPLAVGEAGKCGRNAHSFIFSPDERFAFAADLGLDAIFVYRFDSRSGQITPHQPAYLRTAKKAGPRHLAFHPTGRFLYAMTEYDNTVIVMGYDAGKGELQIIQTQSTLPDGYSEKSYGADVVIHPGGRLLWVTNRGHDSIASFAIDPASGRLTFLDRQPSGGNFPRSIALDSAARFLLCANEKADAVATFTLDSVSGKLSPVGQPLSLPRPASLWRL